MAESTLSLGYIELRKLIAHYLGMTATVDSWSVSELEVLENCIKSGLRQFYFPAPVVNNMGQHKTHEWTFLKPVTELETIAPYGEGTIAIAITETTVTLTDGVWPSWTDTHGSLVIDTTEYVIASRTDDTHLELAEAWTADTETASDYTLKHDGNYDLPDDFGGIEGKLVIESQNYQPDIVLVGESRIRSLRQQSPQNVNSGSTTTPYYAAVRPKEHTVTTTGQRYEIMFYPLPNDVTRISYVKRILPQMLVDTSLEYPYGGMEHSETIRAACIAAAEEQENGNRLDGGRTYDKKKLFEERLAASIALDKAINGVDFFGFNRDNSDYRHREGRDSMNDRRRQNGQYDGYIVTYNNNTA